MLLSSAIIFGALEHTTENGCLAAMWDANVAMVDGNVAGKLGSPATYSIVDPLLACPDNLTISPPRILVAVRDTAPRRAAAATKAAVGYTVYLARFSIAE